MLFSINLDTNSDHRACGDEWEFTFVDDLVPGDVVSLTEAQDASNLRAVLSVTDLGGGDYRVEFSDSTSQIHKSYDYFYRWSTLDVA